MTMRAAVLALTLLLGGCGEGAATPDAAADAAAAPDAARDGAPAADAAPGDAAAPDGAGGTLSSKYPGDIGIGGDPAVVWAEGFEEGSVGAVTARYDDFKNAPGMTLVGDVPPGSGGAAALRLTAGGSASATDLFKHLPDHDELFARWYAKYDAGITWHHTGVWLGGYNPPLDWPDPQAGLQPTGDDRFSVSLEPVYGVGGAAARFDFYNYWMGMHSWMDVPSGSTAYYGNTLVHQQGFTVDEGSWVCLEVHVRLNPDPAVAAGAVLEVWQDDALVARFDDAGPLGYWIRDKFCPTGADGAECTDYPAPADTVLELRFRSTTALQLNAFWPQNYITEGAEGSVQYDDMVVATERVGCLR
jgi:hypothetical protein